MASCRCLLPLLLLLGCWILDAAPAARQRKIDELLRLLADYARPTPVPQISSTTEFVPSSVSPSLPFETNHTSDFPGSFSDQESSYREFYRVFYGTEEGIRHLKKNYGPNGLKQARARYTNINRGLDDMRRANEHVLRIRTRARCSTPTPVLVRVQDYYPDPSREYFPRCTLLHKCGEASGCCENDAYKCVPKAVQEVALHFYTIAVGEHGLSNHLGSHVPTTARLLFDNHTSCECQPVNDWPRLASQEKRRAHPLDGAAPPADGQPKCRECPVPFTSRVYRDGSCGCDCFYRQRPCLRIKRGKRPLAEVERRCIEASFCQIPDCEFGVYNHTSGYCPRKLDRYPRSLRFNAQHPM